MTKFITIFIGFSIFNSYCFSQRPLNNCPLALAGADVSVCSGGSIIIGTTAHNDYSYSWSPTTGLSNPNIAQPVASPTQTTTYTLTVKSLSENLIVNGDFESGLSNFTTDYGIFPNGVGCSQGGVFGSIDVVSNPYLELGTQYCNQNSHPPFGNNMLFVDGTCIANQRVWSQNVAVLANTQYYFTGWISGASWRTGSTAWDQANIRIRINGTDVLQNFMVASCQNWQQFSITWNSGSMSSALLEIFDDNLESDLNDFCLDDLYFSKCPETSSQITVTVGQNLNPPNINPSGTVNICSNWESMSNPVLLTTNLTSNIQWYKNGAPISNANSQSYTAYAEGGQGNIIKTYSYSVKNTQTNCLSTPTIINFVPNPAIFASTLCYGVPIRLTSPYYSSGATYTWYVPGAIMAPPNGHIQDITFPTSYSNNYFDASVAITNSYGCNGTDVKRFYFQNCRSKDYSANNSDQIFYQYSRLFPNPAFSKITIEASEVIQEAEINSALYPIKKKIYPNGTNLITVEISDLKEGFYTCIVKTKSGIEVLKLLIKRQ